MITIRAEDVQTRAALRVLVAKTWGKNSATSGDWEVLPMARIGKSGQSMEDGYRLTGTISRHALPMVGEATFCFDYGLFAHGILGATSSADVDTPGDVDLPALRDLRGYEVRIQAAPRTDIAEWPTTGWRTIWWGQVEYQTDVGDPGSPWPAGRRMYTCADGFQRTRNWPLLKHGLYVTGPDAQIGQYPAAGTDSEGIEGFPGYNYNDGVGTAGNRESTSAVYTRFGQAVPMFSLPGASNATTWTDLQAVNHALLVARPQLEPVFAMAGTTSLLSSASVWRVTPGESAQDIALRILDRRRGRGLAYVDWADDSSAPTGPLTVKISIKPQLLNDMTVAMPSGAASVIIDGATTAASFILVDLIGDHRVIKEATRLSDRYQNQVGYLETVGEQIEVAVTGRVGDGGSMTAPYAGVMLNPAWTTAQKTAFDALSNTDRADLKYSNIYTTFTLPLAWRGQSMDGNGSGAARIDYRCSDAGGILTPTGDPDTSPDSVEILSDLPYLVGYDYTTNPAVRVSSVAQGATPRRSDPMIMLREQSDGYTPCDGDNDMPATLRIDKKNITVTFSGDQDSGIRTVGDVSIATLGSIVNGDYTNLTLTFAIRLPHRLRFASGDPTSRRRKRIEIPDAHLWLSPPQTIWGFTTTDVAPYPAKRSALTGGVSSSTAGPTGSPTITSPSVSSYDGTNGNVSYSIGATGATSYGATGLPAGLSVDSATGSITGTLTGQDSVSFTVSATNGTGTSTQTVTLHASSPLNGDYRIGRLRDDRDRVAVLHALAWRWYGDEYTRVTGTWALNACGFLPSFSAIRGDGTTPLGNPEDITYPKLGDFVMIVSMNGQAHDANCPITSVVYDVDADQTTWTLDWQDLDYV